MKIHTAQTVLWFLIPALFGHVQPGYALETTPGSPFRISKDGKLGYTAAPNGDRVPDFSFCGYQASEMPIPDVPVKIIVPALNGDATAQIQTAIDYVSSLPPDKDGFRGAVLLEKGTYEVSGGLVIRTSGVVLRGSGCGTDGTVLFATGVDRKTLIRVTGINNRETETPVQVADKYFPVNSTVLTFKNGHPFKTGDQVLVNRPSTKEWIEHIGADKIGIHVDYPLTKWNAGDFDQNWYRKAVAVTPESITLDVPLTCSLDPEYGGGNVAKYSWPGQIQQVGVENLRCVSAFDSSNAKDENHRWMAVTMDSVSDSWVRRIVAEHFVSSAVAVWETARRITVEDCKSLAPIGETGNYRRYAFQTLGQQVLFQRCYAEYAWHAFSAGFTAPGPNAFVQCFSYLPCNFSGAVGGWATGVLFDRMTIDGGDISFAYRDADGQGGGWSAANSLCWQCRAARILLPAPPDAQNWAYGSRAQGYGNGHHELPSVFLKPESLYYAQLEDRTGRKSPEEDKILIYAGSETRTPSFDHTVRMSGSSRKPDVSMYEWIDQMIAGYPVQENLSAAKKLSETGFRSASPEIKKGEALSIKNGRFVLGGKIATGKRNRTSMWCGTARPGDIAKADPNLVRFVPGRTGHGLTDDLDTVIGDMLKEHVVAMQSFPALWYERRRDDHARTRRADADVWVPFYEQPFCRSGQGEAYDRLSKYDLTKWNTWYWLRLRQFADLSDRNGLIYIEEHYLQHNLIEEGAHWADYPWRTANNINNPGFPEYPAYAGDRRVYMAEQFYDTTNAVLKAFHEAYIRKSLDNFKGNTNIVHHLGTEYTGPLHFAQFWLDVIAQWEEENHQHVLVMLPGTKDVQDAILADPKRSKTVDAIDVIQWQYQKDGSLYAPPGGVSMAGRQYERLMNPGKTSFDQIYRAASEFHAKYPDKAIMYSRRGIKYADWAVFMGGGSLASLPEIADEKFLRDAAEMQPCVSGNEGQKQYVLGKQGGGYIIFCESQKMKIDLSKDQTDYQLIWINPDSGEMTRTQTRIQGGKETDVEAPFGGAATVWLSRLPDTGAAQ